MRRIQGPAAAVGLAILLVLTAVAPLAERAVAYAEQGSHLGEHADGPASTTLDLVDDDPLAIYLRREHNLPTIESRRRIMRQQQMLELVAVTREYKGQTWAGFWIDHGEDGRLHVAATSWSNNEKNALGAAFDWPELLAFETVIYTLEDLLEAFDRAAEERAELRVRGFSHYELSVDVVGNGLTIYSDELIANQKQDLQSRYMVPLTFAPGLSKVEPECHTSRRCDPPLRGGIRLETSTGTRRGAGGFVARNPAGTWYLITAGHTWSTGQIAYQPTDSFSRRRIGGVPASITAGWVDAARIYVESPSFWSPSRWVWLADNAQAFALTSRNDTAADAGPGVLLCRGGGHTGTSCGEVLRTFASSTRGGIEYTRQLRTNICSGTGDSGSPLFSRYASENQPAARAFSVHGGSNASQYPCGHPGFRAYSSHIEYVQDQLEITVWVQ